MTSRRAFLSAALALASARLAAQDKRAARVYHIGVLDPVSLQASRANMDQFLKGLDELGYRKGANLSMEYLSADGRSERFAGLAAELVGEKVELILTSGTQATLAAKAASAGRIPVVTAVVVDPVQTKLVQSLEHPGGQVTGLAILAAELEAKRMDLLLALAPGRTRIAVIMDMGNPALAAAWKAVEPAAHTHGLEAELIDVRRAEDMPRAYAAAVARRADAMTVRFGSLTPASRREMVEAAVQHRLPTIYASRRFVEAGGLASYGVNVPQLFYRAAGFVDRILKGGADLPMERATRFELVLNRLAAHRLGLIIPPDLLLKSDQVLG